MKIQPVSSPHAVKQFTTNESAAAEAKARAVAKLTGGDKPAAQAAPVPNPSQISPEELGAVKAPSQAPTNVEAAQPTKEAPKQATATTEETDAVATRLAKLAQKERAIRIKQQQQEQAIKAREEALAKREAELAEKYKLDQTQYISKQRLKENTLDVLAEAEVTYDELTNQVLNQQPKNPRYEAYIQKLEAQIAELTEKTNKVEKTYETQQQEAYNSAIKQLKTDANKLVNTDPNYELIKNAGEVDKVVDLIERTYKEDGELLSVQEAAEMIEKEIEERTLKFFEKTEKLKKRLAPKAPASAQEQPVQTKTQEVTQTQPIKTLTNNNSSTRQLSARERAILAFRGELKS